ncbi:hypothetical protein GALL_528350 [mine drainage metagenome]|uniref:Uncharacterized protein n=1 Tax=mine drainage metagenome TaxID=410659 RepID=A0A1J5PPW8_9ZZZZ
MGSPGITDDVGERFLHDAKNHHRTRFIQINILIGQLHGADDAAALAKFSAQPVDGSHQPHVERRRAQICRHVSHPLNSTVNQRLHVLDFILQGRGMRDMPPGCRCQVHAQRREYLPEFVVNFTRNVLALLFQSGLVLCREGTQVGFGLGKTLVGFQQSEFCRLAI